MTRIARMSVIVALAIMMGAALARAQVDCSDPDNLCTGDPCVIPSLSVASPCVVDFASREVIVNGRLAVAVASGGVLSITAQTVRTRGAIQSGNPKLGGGTIALTAAGDLFVEKGSIKASNVTLSAGNDILIAGSLRNIIPIGGVTAEAGGHLTVKRAIKAKASLYFLVQGGSIRLHGGSGVVVERTLDASGGYGAEIDVQSASGGV